MLLYVSINFISVLVLVFVQCFLCYSGFVVVLAFLVLVVCLIPMTLIILPVHIRIPRLILFVRLAFIIITIADQFFSSSLLLALLPNYSSSLIFA